MLTLILITNSFQIIFAQNSFENTITGIRTEIEYQELGLLNNSDNFNFSQRLDTIILVYKYFTVKKRMTETSEEIFIYCNNKKVPINNFSGYYFLGIKNDRFVIFDKGTAATRDLVIYDLYKKSRLFEIVYYGNLILKNKLLHFKTEVIIDDEKLKPKCPSDIESLSYKIYLEEQYIDFHDLEIIHTGKYFCSFIE